MHLQLAISIWCLVCIVWSTNAISNDSTARVSAGGIVLQKNQHIRMLQEILEVSTKTIRVRYRFVNESDSDIQTTVAFPMPLYGWNPGMSALDMNIGPVKSFKLLVDGQLRPTQHIRRAMSSGRDITEHLRKLGLSERTFVAKFAPMPMPYANKLPMFFRA